MGDVSSHGVPLLVLVQLIHAIYFVTGHHQAFDLVKLNPCLGHQSCIPLLVASPPNINARACRERVVPGGVHCARFVAGNVESKRPFCEFSRTGHLHALRCSQR